MDKYLIKGGKKLFGEISISGSKNSTLAILPACLLIEGRVTLSNIPKLKDVEFMLRVLKHLGVEYQFSSGELTLDSTNLKNQAAPYDLVRKMRASIYVLAPLLHRFQSARVSLPGGCAIGSRPVDIHLKGLKDLGVKIELDHGYINAESDSMTGTEIYFDFPSVGATCQLIMAGVLAEGETILYNAAKEPEIIDLCNFLNLAGAGIEGMGSNSIKIQGVQKLKPCKYRIMPDRIESGSFAITAAACGGEITLTNIFPEHIESVLDKLTETGAVIKHHTRGITVKGPDRPDPVNLKTLPYPGFPTDLQSPFMTYLTIAGGASIIKETIFENRFNHVPELNRLGASITVEGQTAYIKGVAGLLGAPIMASDLRAGFALVLAGLMSDGETIINRIYHIDRGYENLEDKLKNTGAIINRIT